MKRTLLGFFAHPDDESMGPGGTLAKYAALGHRVAFVTATDGGAGRLYKERPADNTRLRELRREETARAASILGVEFLGFLGWPDRGLEAMSILDIEAEFARIIRTERPDVVLTFHGSGISYHPDHRVVWMGLSSAVLGAARRDWYPREDLKALPPHHTARFYAYAVARSRLTEDWPRTVYAAEDDEITTTIDTRNFADTRWSAIRAHDTQRDGPPFEKLFSGGFFDAETFVRVVPSPVPGAARETDFFEGL